MHEHRRSHATQRLEPGVQRVVLLQTMCIAERLVVDMHGWRVPLDVGLHDRQDIDHSRLRLIAAILVPQQAALERGHVGVTGNELGKTRHLVVTGHHAQMIGRRVEPQTFHQVILHHPAPQLSAQRCQLVLEPRLLVSLRIRVGGKDVRRRFTQGLGEIRAELQEADTDRYQGLIAAARHHRFLQLAEMNDGEFL